MPSENNTKPHEEENEQGFPIQLKILLVVIGMGVLAMLFKAIGIF